MLGLIRKILSVPFAIKRIEKKIDDLLVLTGRSYSRSFNTSVSLDSIMDAEFKIFSQWGDDGIIQYLIKRLAVRERRFIEFGIENYRESNTRFLLINNNWAGLVFDGSPNNIQKLREDDIFWRHNLKAECAFVTRENINTLISANGFEGKIGLLHIDIDGNDYWIWEAITGIEADIIIVEYNAYFGNERCITIPYNAAFVASKAHYSRIYFGASLPALVELAKRKGYFHIGCNSAGNNAYFLRDVYAGKIKELSAKEGFVMPRSRQTRNTKNELTFLEEHTAIALIKGLPVINVINGEIEQL